MAAKLNLDLGEAIGNMADLAGMDPDEAQTTAAAIIAAHVGKARKSFRRQLGGRSRAGRKAGSPARRYKGNRKLAAGSSSPAA